MKVTERLQVAPAARVEPQPLVRVKAAVLVPVSEMLVMLNAALPGLLSVSGWEALVVPLV